MGPADVPGARRRPLRGDPGRRLGGLYARQLRRYRYGPGTFKLDLVLDGRAGDPFGHGTRIAGIIAVFALHMAYVASVSAYEVPIYADNGWLAPLDSYVKADEDFDQGDVDCSGGINAVDALKVLRAVAMPQNVPRDS